MNLLEFARATLETAPVGVVITDSRPRPPGPTILYANAAFGQMTGHEVADIIGLTPRFMQGRETRRASLDMFSRALTSGTRFHGYLTNYRRSGDKYRVEIDCRPIRCLGGAVDCFISFEREVTRRIGRPASGRAGRYEPKSVSNDDLTEALLAMGVFRQDQETGFSSQGINQQL